MILSEQVLRENRRFCRPSRTRVRRKAQTAIEKAEFNSLKSVRISSSFSPPSKISFAYYFSFRLFRFHQKMPIKNSDKPLATEFFARQGTPKKARRRLTFVSRAAFEV
jgi:hypothetical protein